MVDFGNRLKSLRLKQNWTQSQLAQRIGLTKSVVSAYETGIRMPSYEVLIELSRLFKVSTDYLLGTDTPTELDLSGLSEPEILAIRNLIKAIKSR